MHHWYASASNALEADHSEYVFFFFPEMRITDLKCLFIYLSKDWAILKQLKGWNIFEGVPGSKMTVLICAGATGEKRTPARIRGCYNTVCWRYATFFCWHCAFLPVKTLTGPRTKWDHFNTAHLLQVKPYSWQQITHDNSKYKCVLSE